MDIERFLKARRAKRRLLTPRRREVLRTFQAMSERDDYPPTVRELMRELGLSSTASVHAHLTSLELAGHLVRSETKVRRWEVAVSAAETELKRAA